MRQEINNTENSEIRLQNREVKKRKLASIGERTFIDEVQQEAARLSPGMN